MDEDEPSDQELFLFMAVSEKIEEVERLRALLREARTALSNPIIADLAGVIAKIDDELAKE